MPGGRCPSRGKSPTQRPKQAGRRHYTVVFEAVANETEVGVARPGTVPMQRGRNERNGGRKKLLWEGLRTSRLAGDASPLRRRGQSEEIIARAGAEIDVSTARG